MSHPNRITITRERDGFTARAEAFHIDDSEPDGRGLLTGWYFRSYLTPEQLCEAHGPELVDELVKRSESVYDALAEMCERVIDAKELDAARKGDGESGEA